MEFLGEPAYNLDKELVFGDWTLNIQGIIGIGDYVTSTKNTI
jgi:hypothetical protein